MELNDLPTRQDKKQFIEGFLYQHKKHLFTLLDDVPENWNSWHLRKFIKDTIHVYSLSLEEEIEYKDCLKPEWMSNDLIRAVAKFMKQKDDELYI